MPKKQGSFRRKTRQKLRKSLREKGKISLSSYFQSFEPGEKVLLNAEPAVQKGMFYPRFHGKVGKITAKRGKCYELTITDGTKKKMLIVHPIHLKKMR